MLRERPRSFLAQQRRRGPDVQSRSEIRQMIRSWLGALLAISLLGLLGLLGSWSQDSLIAAPFDASSLLLLAHPGSPLAQPRNLVAGDTLAALNQRQLRTAVLHPPARAVALLGAIGG